MADQSDRERPVYSDAFMAFPSEWGVLLRFMANIPQTQPNDGKGNAQPARIVQYEQARVGMSLQQYKMLAFVASMQVRDAEGKLGHSIELSDALLAASGITRANWDLFWYGKRPEPTALVGVGAMEPSK